MSICLAAGSISCGSNVEAPPAHTETAAITQTPEPAPQPTVAPTPAIPNLQSELLDGRNKTTDSPLGNFDFKNFSYPLPRGWENPDGSDITLVNGRRQPKVVDVGSEPSDEERMVAKAERRIGMSYVTTKYLDINNDGQDEALVVLKIETAGSAIPQVVYVYAWKDNKPDLIWTFRTGDRADGGLKDLRAENGLLVIELYGQDRFVLGATETGKIGDDIEQLCCPTHFSRSTYKWNGTSFLMQGKRLTFSVADPSAAPIENMADIVNARSKSSGKK
ncbi:MAG: hypothetical protein K1X36_05350 [Pyrinomonadaceae bacterium]|nr:hypothetical protein [Pyrinomonadaceae bacterium]